MNDKDWQQRLKRGQAQAEAGRMIGFDQTWNAANRRLATRQRRRRVVSGLAAAIALTAVVASLLQSRQPAWEYVDPEDFVTSTSWRAPSDVLLPDYRIDIYEEIPVLIESTEIDGGTLL